MRAALIAGVVSLLAAAPAVAKPPAATLCKAPKSGFQSCLRVLYKTPDDGTAQNVRATATLVLRVDACRAKATKRRVVLSQDGERLASAQRAGRCHKGVVTWSARFPASQTAAWGLVKGDTVDAAWSGVRNAASVAIH